MVSRKDLRFLTTYGQVEGAVNLWNSATNRVKNKNEKIQNKYNTPAVNNYKSNLNLTTYNPRYPGFDENDYKKLEQGAINRGLTGEQKTQFMDEAYQYYYPQVLNQHGLEKRAEEINQMAAENGSSILNGNKQAEMNMKIVDLAQTAKRVKGFAYDYPDEQIIDAMANEIPDGQQLLINYLNNGDDTILYRAGLKKTDAQTKAEQYNKAKENINKALVQNWKQLSDDGLKYLRNYNVMFQAVDEARLEGMGQGMSDDELLLNLIYASPELQQLEQELGTLNLDSGDKAILGIVDDTSGAIRPERHQLTNTVRDWLGWNSDTPATINDIAEEIYVRDNMDGQTWKNAKANWRNWGDSIAKFGYRLPKDNRNWAVDSDIARFGAKLFGMSDEEIDEKIKNIKSENINKVKLFNEMTDKEQQDYKKQIGLDPIVENYYNNQGIVESLFNGNPEGAWYKSVGETTGNIDMLAGIGASIINPAFGLAIMGTDTYARENQEAFENLINAQTSQGVSYEDAYKNASEGAVLVGAINTAIELGLEKVLGGVETTTAGNIKEIATKGLNKEVSDMIARRGILGMLGQGLQTQARSSLEEGLEEVFQQLTQNVAASGYDPNQEITEGLLKAFESGALNPMNLLAGGTDVINNIDGIENAMYNSAYDAGVMSRKVVDALHNPKSIISNIKTRYNNLNNGIIENPGNIQGNTMVENTTINRDGDKATFKEELYAIDPTLKRNLQNNPYSAEVWQRTKDYIDKNGRPERSNDVAKQLIVDVADKVQQKLMEKMEEGGEKGKLYQAIDNAGYEVDLSELRDGLLDEILAKYGIEIEEKEMGDGTTKTVLNFDKTAIDGSEASNINKIYKWIKSTNTPMSEVEFRTRLKQSMQDMVNFNPNNRDQAGRKKGDTPGDKVIKGILKAANDLAHSQIPELADLDSIYSEWVDFMDDVSDGLVYKDAAKRGVIKDNVYQIIKNLDEPSRRQMVNRLERLIPGIKEEVSAINQMPKVIDHYYNPSKLQKGLTSETLKAVGSVGGLPGYLMLKWGGEKLSGKIDKLKSEAWDKVLSETSEEGKAKMREIQERIENNKALTQQQANFLKNLSERIEKATQQIETPSEVTETATAPTESNNSPIEEDEYTDDVNTQSEEEHKRWVDERVKEILETEPSAKATKREKIRNRAELEWAEKQIEEKYKSNNTAKNQVSSKTATEETENNQGRTLNNEVNENGPAKEMTAEEEYQQMVNRIMTPKEVETIVEMAWQSNKIRDFYDGEYKSSLDWLKGEGSDEVEMYANNTFATQRMIESHPELLDGGTTFSEVLDAYLDGTLTGKPQQSIERMDLSQAEEYTPTKFYEPQELKNSEEVWKEANKRVTNSNRNEVYQARGEFVIDAHNPGFAQELGLTDAEVNKKLKTWADYPVKAKDLSNKINEGVAAPYRWAGLENSSIVKSITVTDGDLEKMVKKIEGNSSEYQRKYISNTMLALDTHIDWSPLTFNFVRGGTLDHTDGYNRHHSVLGNYNENTNTISIATAGQNTVAHEMGHYLDYLRGRQLFGFNVTLSEGGARNMDTLTSDQQKFVNHFDNFMTGLKTNADLYNDYTMTPTEIFARFVARFTEWTRNTATNDRFGYEAKRYNDKFISSDFIEFAKILQEKSKLDLANEYSNYDKYLEKNEQRKGKPGETNSLLEVDEEISKEDEEFLENELFNTKKKTTNKSEGFQK